MDPDKSKWFDFHCHFCDIIEFDKVDLDIEIAEAQHEGVGSFFSNAYRKDQFDWHLSHSYPFMQWYAGIHPMFVEETQQDIASVIELAQKKQICAIGEIGLDSRYDNHEVQERLMLMQLDIAKSYDLPVVFHSVGRYYEIYKLVKNNFPKTRGVLHSFASSEEVFEIFKSLGFAFSLGGPILTSRNHEKVLHDVLEWGLYVLETDAPAQKPFFAETEYCKLKFLPEIATRICEIAGIEASSLRNTTWKSLENLGIISKSDAQESYERPI